MKIYKLSIVATIIVMSFNFGLVALAQTVMFGSDFDINAPRPEIYIDKNGKTMIVGAKVIQFAGSTIYTRVIWDNSFIRLMVKTDQSTKITRRYGELIKVSNVAINDYIGIEGNLESNADSLSIIASAIKDLSDQTQQNTFSGTLTAINNSLTSFTLDDKNLGSIQIVIGTSTQIVLGSRIVDIAHMKIGDKIISVDGVYNYANKTLMAKNIKVYIDLSIFKPKNYTGVLKIVPGKTLPTTMVVTIKSKDYTVNLSADTQIINNKRKATALSRFVEDDTIVLYGNIRESDDLIIDNVEIVRDASL